ncbi:MAG: 6-pyruvoyl tetrahydropterin synthase family protein [Planctomycetota bacterium]
MPYEITIERSFHATHALRLPDGSLEPVHAHDWPVRLTVAADALDAMQCVMDFHDLEPALDAVLATLDGKHLNDVPPFDTPAWNPSAERVAEHVATQVGKSIPAPARLIACQVGEAPGCYATYRPI